MGLPPNTRTVILRFGLTDMNVRRDYSKLTVYQMGSPAKIDLTNHFFAGPHQLPTFGSVIEVVMPWEMNLEAKLVVEFQCAPQQPYQQPPPYHIYDGPGANHYSSGGHPYSGGLPRDPYASYH